MPSSGPIARVAVPTPLYRYFDYLAPPSAGESPAPGTRVRVPFGRGRAVGIVVENDTVSELPRARLKRIQAVLDDAPLLPADIFELARWAADYYQHPPGEVFAAVLPALLRQGAAPRISRHLRWRLTAAGRDVDPAGLSRAPRQAALLQRLGRTAAGLAPEEIRAEPGNWDAALRSLRTKGWVEAVEEDAPEPVEPAPPADAPDPGPAQRDALEEIDTSLGRFACFLLDGVTGSGKTEVYLRAVARVLERSEQALVLVPEIGLTPQLVDRFQRRLAVPMAVFHSGLTDRERTDAWLRARDGRARVIIGTRSAVFVPLARPGLIVVDEEHDSSFKQQEGFRYSARDLAVLRAQRLAIPAVLGSATPSLDSLANCRAGRYRRLVLAERAGTARPPHLRLVDVRAVPLREGLSPVLLEAMRTHLDGGGQVLLFLNRRGFAPTLRCHGCGWIAQCRRCDARLTLHGRGSRKERLLCHHCGVRAPVPSACPECAGDIDPLGQGTERVEEALAEQFPDTGIARIDRDTTQRKGAMQTLLDEARAGQSRILLGTQMLAKGHHFPDVSLAGILDADQGLFGVDFRAAERMAQLIVQVAGRAGRADREGEVLIQTHHPEHPLLRTLIRDGYPGFAEVALAERRAAALPPYSRLALLRAEAPDPAAPGAFLQAARNMLADSLPEGVWVMGPVPAPMERRAGRHRAQLLVQAPDRPPLQRLLRDWVPRLAGHRLARRVRWSVDVDPADMY